MKSEILQRAKVLESCMEVCKQNIKHLEKIRTTSQIKIDSTTTSTIIQPIYIDGEDKDYILDYLINKQKNFLKEDETAFENL